MPDRAIKYALRARDYGFAAELLERQGVRLIAGNRVYGVLSMLNSVPVEVIREHPVFQIFYAWQLAFEQKFAEAEALIEEVSTRLAQGRGKVIRVGLAELLVAVQLLKALVLLYQDKLESCLKGHPSLVESGAGQSGDFSRQHGLRAGRCVCLAQRFCRGPTRRSRRRAVA